MNEQQTDVIRQLDRIEKRLHELFPKPPKPGSEASPAAQAVLRVIKEEQSTSRKLSTRKSSREILVSSLGGCCRVCGNKNGLELHHIVPISRGGPDTVANLVLLCYEHHKMVPVPK